MIFYHDFTTLVSVIATLSHLLFVFDIEFSYSYCVNFIMFVSVWFARLALERDEPKFFAFAMIDIVALLPYMCQFIYISLFDTSDAGLKVIRASHLMILVRFSRWNIGLQAVGAVSYE